MDSRRIFEDQPWGLLGSEPALGLASSSLLQQQCKRGTATSGVRATCVHSDCQRFESHWNRCGIVAGGQRCPLARRRLRGLADHFEKEDPAMHKTNDGLVEVAANQRNSCKRLTMSLAAPKSPVPGDRQGAPFFLAEPRIDSGGVPARSLPPRRPCGASSNPRATTSQNRPTTSG